jgi:hypothetical protein
MKKLMLILTALLMVSFSLNAADKEIKTFKIDGKQTSGKIKAGVSLGYPTGLTFGWRPSDFFEANLLLATNFEGITIGFTPLFTLINLEVENQIFPLSAGPSVNLNLGSYSQNIDILGLMRLEYSFKEIPLNLYLEGGLGLNMELGNDAGASLGGSGALGVRYIF